MQVKLHFEYLRRKTIDINIKTQMAYFNVIFWG
jgi:hypothetical protein